ncbi:membrane-flanked domain protein [Anopheles sinensis]|uniref:Membrane-flanked domain protein n=1 Tax=Anopheles sinensis TaxID=74873 RepID=A0A084VDL0_ANOSI|nr:membrane-flanked domain protein [Anopheles sinensis]
MSTAQRYPEWKRRNRSTHTEPALPKESETLDSGVWKRFPFGGVPANVCASAFRTGTADSLNGRPRTGGKDQLSNESTVH